MKAQKQKKDHPLSWYREQHKKIPVDKYKAKWSKTQTLHDAWGDTYTVHKNNYGPLGRPPSLRDNKREYNKPHNTLTVKGLMNKYSNDPAKMKEYLRTHPHSPYGLDRNGNPIKRGSSEAIVKRYAGKKAVKTPSKAQSKVPKGKRGAVKQPTKAQIKKMMDANREYVNAMSGTVVPTLKPRAKTKETKGTKKATAKAKTSTAKKPTVKKATTQKPVTKAVLGPKPIQGPRNLNVKLHYKNTERIASKLFGRWFLTIEVTPDGKKVVNFYDVKGGLDKKPQFVADYYLDDLLGMDGGDYIGDLPGLNLRYGVPEWSIGQPLLFDISVWLFDHRFGFARSEKPKATTKRRVSRSRVPLGPTRATFNEIEKIKMNEEMAYRAALAGYEDEMAYEDMAYRDMRSVDADLIDRGAKDHRRTVMRLGNKNKVKFLKNLEWQEYKDRNYY